MSDIGILKARLEDLAVFYSSVRSSVIEISAKSKSGDFSKEELCDIGFLCREFVSKSEEIRKDIGAVKELVDRLVCIKALQYLLMNPTKSDTVHGELSSGTPRYKKSVTLPKKDTEEYTKMCEYFGITKKGIEDGVAKISWKKVCNHITELTELGKPIPDFIPRVHDDYTVTHRRK